MLEKKIEEYLVKRVRECGGIAFKFISPSRRGVPDRICVLPDGLLFFVELKTKTGRLGKSQEREIARLRGLGQWVFILRSKEDIDDLLKGF